MKTKPLLFHATAAIALALLAGCASEPGSSTPQDTTKYTVENTEKFVLLDPVAQASVTCTGLNERTLPDGRIEVVASVKNRTAQHVEVQLSCVFKNEQGFSTEDETPLQSLALAGNSTEAVRFTAGNTLAKKYTIRVRQAR